MSQLSWKFNWKFWAPRGQVRLGFYAHGGAECYSPSDVYARRLHAQFASGQFASTDDREPVIIPFMRPHERLWMSA